MILRLLRYVRTNGLGGTLRRISRRVDAWGLTARMQLRNLVSHAPVTGEADAIVSLTSYGPRLRTVHLVIESVGAGTTRPRRLILWVDDPTALTESTSALRRLVERGLEFRLAEPLGSHKKYYPALGPALDDNVSRLVTIDDDVLYPRWWLERLMAAASESPEAVVAYRARQVLLTAGDFAPWAEWPLCDSTEASLLHMGIGEAGIAYPRPVVESLLRRGKGFLEVAARMDDIWLHSTAVSIGVPTRQVMAESLHLEVLPGSQSVALAQTNILGGGNDAALRQNYDTDGLARLRASANSDDL